LKREEGWRTRSEPVRASGRVSISAADGEMEMEMDRDGEAERRRGAEIAVQVAPREAG